MKTFAFISIKGGVGKSTLARQFSVFAGESGPSVLIDRDQPQNTTTDWYARRQREMPDAPEPKLLDLADGSLTAAVQTLKSRPGTIFIDTRPTVSDVESEAARMSDLVVVPVGASPDDITAIRHTIAMLRRLECRAVIVVNAADNERRALEAKAALSRFGVPVCPQHVVRRPVFHDAGLAGRGMGEMKGPAARRAEGELREVWAWVKEAGE